MRISGTIEGLDEYLAAEIAEIKQVAQSAMAERFFELTRENFGESGVDRPNEWPPLSEKYAKRVKRDYATMFLSGELELSFQWDGSNLQYAEVWSDSPYAVVHNDGDSSRNIPARPVFPIIGKSDDPQARLTDFAEQQILEAANQAIQNLIR
jgi:phage gpG-like protein